MKEGQQGSGGNKVLLWGYPLFTCTLNPAWNKLVAFARMKERCCCSKSWYVHFNYSFVDLTVIVRRHFRDQEWELLGHVDTYEKLLGDISIAVRVRKDDIHNVSSSA
jgi:hypothetical protein